MLNFETADKPRDEVFPGFAESLDSEYLTPRRQDAKISIRVAIIPFLFSCLP